MNLREPKIRQQSATGAYVVRWNGRDHYLSTDRAEAERLFTDKKSTHPGSLAQWRAWSAQRRTRSRNAPGSKRLRLIDAEQLMFASYIAAGRTQAAGFWRSDLARFLQIHGEARLVEFASPDPARGRYSPPVVAFLNAYRTDLARAAPKKRLSNRTINHDLAAVVRLFNWSAEQGLCPAVNWRGLKKLHAARGKPEVWPIERLAAAIAAAGKNDPRVVPWLALCYLTVARASELPRLIARTGEFEPVYTAGGKLTNSRGLFSLSLHKSSWRGDPDLKRHMVLTDEALEWLDLARPFWGRLDSFSKAAIDAGFAPGPHILRDSAASHLRLRGVALADVDVLLGHVPSGEWRSYALMPWHDLRQKAARISLRSTLGPAGSWAPSLHPEPPRRPPSNKKPPPGHP